MHGVQDDSTGKLSEMTSLPMRANYLQILVILNAVLANSLFLFWPMYQLGQRRSSHVDDMQTNFVDQSIPTRFDSILDTKSRY